VPGEQESDHQNGAKIINDCQGQQEGAQAARQRACDHREDGQRERNVGRERNRPATWLTSCAEQVDRQIDHRRSGHAADGGHDRHQRVAWPRQRPDGQLTLQLQTGDEEEDRQQPVRCPVLGI
jgi:hypothetical protein